MCSAVFPGSRALRKGFAQIRADGVMPEGYTTQPAECQRDLSAGGAGPRVQQPASGPYRFPAGIEL